MRRDIKRRRLVDVWESKVMENPVWLVNWSAIGPVAPEEAQEFASAILDAAVLAFNRNTKRVKTDG